MKANKFNESEISHSELKKGLISAWLAFLNLEMARRNSLQQGSVMCYSKTEDTPGW